MRTWEMSRIAADWTQMASFLPPELCWCAVLTPREMLALHAEVSVNSASECALHFGNIETKKPGGQDSIHSLKQCF